MDTASSARPTQRGRRCASGFGLGRNPGFQGKCQQAVGVIPLQGKECGRPGSMENEQGKEGGEGERVVEGPAEESTEGRGWQF